MSEKMVQLSIRTELPLIARDASTTRTVEIVVTPPAAVKTGTRPRLNLALVLDRSGSMSGEKLVYVKEAAMHLLELLDEHDRVVVVAYDDAVKVVAESCLVTPENRLRIKQAIMGIESGATTNLSDGWLTGCGEVAKFHAEGQLERTLLLTDGLANVGIVELEELAGIARELNNKGVSTSTFGVGDDFNEHLLEAVATTGGGSYHYISSPQLIPAIFIKEFGELAAVTLRDVEITLDVPAGVIAQLVGGGWRVEATKGRMRFFIGALQSGRPQALYVSVLLPPSTKKGEVALKCRVMGRGEGNQVCEDGAALTFQYEDAGVVASAPRDQGLLERCAQVRLAEAVNQALKLERAGDREQAYQTLMQAIEAGKPYLKAEEIKLYVQMAERMRRGMQEPDRKSSHHAAYISRQSRK
jgi:Ca-activated chloride channel family protein